MYSERKKEAFSWFDIKFARHFKGKSLKFLFQFLVPVGKQCFKKASSFDLGIVTGDPHVWIIMLFCALPMCYVFEFIQGLRWLSPIPWVKYNCYSGIKLTQILITPNLGHRNTGNIKPWKTQKDFLAPPRTSLCLSLYCLTQNADNMNYYIVLVLYILW